MTPLPESPTKFRYTLPRSARLRGDAAFRYLWKFGLYQREGALGLRAVFFPIALSEPPVKVAFSVRKKVLRKAARRHRVRRLLREAHRRLYPEWEAGLGTAEVWLLWSWESAGMPSLNELFPLMRDLYERAYRKWEGSLFF